MRRWGSFSKNVEETREETRVKSLTKEGLNRKENVSVQGNPCSHEPNQKKTVKDKDLTLNHYENIKEGG